MDRPENSVSLTARERMKFLELIDEFGSDANGDVVATRFGWSTRIRLWFWRHRRAAMVLVPIGLSLMMVSVMTLWPLGLLGAPLLGLGLAASQDLFGGSWRRRRLRRSRNKDGNR